MSFRFGVLSTASIVPRFIKAAQDAGQCEVVAIASRSLEKAQEKADLWGIPKAYGSYEELLHSDEIDVVYVAMINSQHYQYVKMALELGKHVLCEKPFAYYEEEIRELFALAREKGLFLMEAQKAVFMPTILKAKELINNGTLGRVHMIEFSGYIDHEYNQWQFDPKEFGGPLFGNCIYSIQISQFLFDCGVAQCSGLATKGKTIVEEQFSAALLLDNGVLFTNRTSTLVPVQHTAIIYGEKGYIEIPRYWKSRNIVLHLNGEEPCEFNFPCESELVYEMQHVVSCLEKGLLNSPVMTEEMTVSANRVMHNLNKLWNPQEYAAD